MARFPRQFYERSTLKVAPEFLGQLFVSQVPGFARDLLEQGGGSAREESVSPGLTSCRKRCDNLV